MQGPFGGVVLPAPNGSRERISAEVLAALRPGQPDAPDAPDALDRGAREAPPARAILVRGRVTDDELRYPTSLAQHVPLDATDEPTAGLQGLAEVGALLDACGQRGEVVGDLRPGTVWVGAAESPPLVVAPPLGGDPAALLRARLRSGAALDAAAYVAPEVRAGEAVTPAADVYALAATAFWALSGRAPTGRLELEQLVPRAQLPERAMLARALDVDPARRPPARAVARALSRLAARERDGAAPAAAAARDAPGSSATVLGCVLVLGGLFVFVGLLSCVISNWGELPDGARLVLLLAFVGAVGGTGLALEKGDYPRSGFAAVVLASQLLWVVMAYLLELAGRIDSPGAWAGGAAAVSAATSLLGGWRGSRLLAALGGLGAAVAAGCFGESISTGSWYGSTVFAAAVAAAYAGVTALALRAGSRPLALSFGAGAVLWAWSSGALGALLLSPELNFRVEPLPGVAGTFALGWPYALAAASLLLAHRLKGLPRLLAAVCGGVLLLGAPTLHGLIAAEGGQLGLLTPVLIYAVLAPPAERWGGAPFGRSAQGLGLLWTWGTALYALGELGDVSDSLGSGWGTASWTTAWPYVAAAAQLAAAWGVARVARPLVAPAPVPGSADAAPPADGADGVDGADGADGTGRAAPALPDGPRGAWELAALSACGVLLVVPTAQALVCHEVIGYLMAAVAIGLLLLGAAFRLPALAGGESRQLLAVVTALPSVTVGPALLALIHCLGKDGFDLLSDALKSFGHVHETRFAYLSVVVGVSGALVLLGVVFSAHARRKLAYRLVESAGLGLFFFTFTVLSLPDAGSEMFFAATVLLGGGAVVALGLYAQRAMLVSIAGAALLFNLFVQYFAKIGSLTHWSLTAVGFGIALLALGVAYERKVKHLLPKLKEWA